MAIRLIDLIGISVFLIAITSVVAAGYTLFGNALEAIGFVVSGSVGTVFGVISVPFVAIKSVVAVQWALFDAIRLVVNIVLDVVSVPLIAIKSAVVAAGRVLFEIITNFDFEHCWGFCEIFKTIGGFEICISVCALFAAISKVHIVVDVISVPLIFMKSTAVAVGNALFDPIRNFEVDVFFDVVRVWLVRLLISLLCMAVVVLIAWLVWRLRTNQLDRARMRNGPQVADVRQIQTVCMTPKNNNTIRTFTVPPLNLPRMQRRDRWDPDECQARTCVVCQDNPRNVVCIPCRHFALCEDCAHRLSTGNFAHGRSCPMCRVPIRELMKVYI